VRFAVVGLGSSVVRPPLGVAVKWWNTVRPRMCIPLLKNTPVNLSERSGLSFSREELMNQETGRCNVELLQDGRKTIGHREPSYGRGARYVYPV
jgi:hypothetical protein